MVLATPPFWLAIARVVVVTGSAVIADPSCRTRGCELPQAPAFDSTHAWTALVTGATAGIGLAFAQPARRPAATTSSWSPATPPASRRSPPSCAATYGVEVEVLTADLVDRDAAGPRRGAARRRSTRPVDLLVNNAGFGLKKRFLDNSVEQEQAMLDVLVTAVMRLSHAALGAMSERGSGGIINVSSVAAFLPRGSYSAAKAYVNSFAQWAANEYRPQGVTVIALCPGFTKTEFHERMDVRRGSAPTSCGSTPTTWSRECLVGLRQGQGLSVPGGQYKAITTATRLVPTSVAAALPVDRPQVAGLGRRERALSPRRR